MSNSNGISGYLSISVACCGNSKMVQILEWKVETWHTE
jgi:hypothetical protein